MTDRAERFSSLQATIHRIELTSNGSVGHAANNASKLIRTGQSSRHPISSPESLCATFFVCIDAAQACTEHDEYAEREVAQWYRTTTARVAQTPEELKQAETLVGVAQQSAQYVATPCVAALLA